MKGGVMFALLFFLAACEPVDLPIEPPQVEERALVVWRGDNSLANYYMTARNIPPSHNLEITGDLGGWTNVWTNYITPLKNKLNELGEESIHYIVLFNMPRKMKYQGKYSDMNVSTVTLTMVAYNLQEVDDTYDQDNPYWKNSCAETFNDPWSGFSHDNINRDRHGLVYMVSEITTEEQINNALYAEENEGEGVHVIDSRYGKYGDIFTNEDFALDTYPHNWKYTYGDMDKKIVTCVRYFHEKGVANYGWDTEYKNVDEDNTHWLNSSGEEEEIPERIKALSYVGGYVVSYPDIFDWQPGSYYAQYSSYHGAVDEALEHGVTYAVMPLFEPYTFGVVQPAEFTYYIEEGYTYGEATLYALPMVLWAHHSVGDPLTRRAE